MAQIVVDDSRGVWFGSGYQVSAELVLTCAHVVPRAGRVRVRLLADPGGPVSGPGRIREVDAEVVCSAPEIDIAVLRLSEADDELAPVAYGHLAEGATWEAVGFPRLELQNADDSENASARTRVYRDSFHAAGSCSRLTGMRSAHLVLELQGPAPAPDPDPKRSPWEGMSGAAVFAEGRLVGIISKHNRREGLARLTAVDITRCYGQDSNLSALRALLGLPAAEKLVRIPTGNAYDAQSSNPFHRPIGQMTAVDREIALDHQAEREQERRQHEFTARLLVRAMAYPITSAAGWWFCGREAVMKDLAAWLNSPSDGGGGTCRVVTGGPGSGKTAVLGMVAALSDPERRRTVPLGSLGVVEDALPRPGVLDAVIYAQNHTVHDLHRALCAAARVDATTTGELLDAIGRRATPLTVLIDALDEADDPVALRATVISPLVKHSEGRIRLLLGTRPYLLSNLGIDPGQILDLDAERYADPEALRQYVARNLLEAHPASPYRDRNAATTLRAVANAVAEAAGSSFLVARIAAGTLAAAERVVADPASPAWRASLPRQAGAAMHEDLEQRLGAQAQWACDLLRPLAYAQGQGLPWEDVWAALAGEIAGRAYTDEDLLRLRTVAGSYTTEAQEHGRPVYRLYHEALAEYLREGADDAGVHAAYTRVLTARVPYDADGFRRWDRAHPYALEHLAYHAAKAGELDQLLADAGFLGHAVPHFLTPHLHSASSDRARLNAAAYRTSLHLHEDMTPQQRLRLLALDAARSGAHTLHEDLVRRIPPDHWVAQWAAGGTFNPALRDTLTGHTDSVLGLACTVLDGIPVAVSGSTDRTVRVWNLRTGQQIGEMAEHDDGVWAVACTMLDDVPVVVGGCHTVSVWNLRTGQRIGGLAGRTGAVQHLACTVLDGVPIVVADGEDHVARVWNLRTGQQIRKLGGGISRNGVACVEVDDVPIAVTAGAYDKSLVWDLRTGQRIGELSGHVGAVQAIACTIVDGVPVAVTGSADRTVRVWNLRTRQQIGALAEHVGEVRAMTCSTLDDIPVAVTVGDGLELRAWDLRTRQQIGGPRTRYVSGLQVVACSVVDGVPVALASGSDHMVWVWDLRAGQRVDEHSTKAISVSDMALAVVDGVTVAVITGWDHTVRVWDLHRGRQIRELGGNTHRESSVACVVIDGAPVAVTAGPDRFTARVWDLRTGQQIGELAGHTEALDDVACTIVDGLPVAVTSSRDKTTRVWNLRTGKQIGRLRTDDSQSVWTVRCTELGGTPVAVTGGWDNVVRVWDLRTGRQIGEPMFGHSGSVPTLACTEYDGIPIAATCDLKKTVQLWDLRTRQHIGELAGHTQMARSVAFTVLDGVPIAATCGDDNMVRLWDVRSRQQTGQIPVTKPHRLAFTPEGRLVVASNDIAVFQRTAG